ncbi:MAG: Efflux transporter, family, subunit [Deltaproteobacteria bacterium]|nr:Efflux transporter, family, subunit [Deltaproteobacteria bacterium]
MNKARVIGAVCIIIAAIIVVYYFVNPSRDRKDPKESAAQTGGHQQGQPPAPAPSSGTGDAASKPEEKPAPTVEMPAEKQQLIGVRTTVASIVSLSKTVRTVGRIEYDERSLTTINTKVEGWIEKLYVNYTGTYVKKGERVADIYSPELWATQQEFISLVRWAKKRGQTNSHSADSQTNSHSAHQSVSGPSDMPDLGGMLARDADIILEAARKRLKLWDISDAQIRKIEQGETPMKTLSIASPVSGYVLQKYAVQGQRIMAGEKLLDVSDLSNVWVVADIYEYEFPYVKVGDEARIRLNSLPDKVFTSRVEFISPTLSAETRTMKVRFSIPNPQGQLKPQMFADVEIKIDLGRKLAVPDEAVIDTGVRKIVYIDQGNGVFEPREVTTGARADKLVEIISGIKNGDKIASSANFLIDSEAKLKGIEAPKRGAPSNEAPAKEQQAAPQPVSPSKQHPSPPASPKQGAAPPAAGHRH